MIQMQIVGTIGKDAEVKTFNEKNVINFSVAVNKGYGEKKTTLWIEVSKWGEKTGIAQFLKKGIKVAVVGEPDLRTWESNGKNGASLTIRATEVHLLTSKIEVENTNIAEAPTSEPATPINDDLPF